MSDAKILVKVWDYDSIASNDLIGVAKVKEPILCSLFQFSFTELQSMKTFDIMTQDKKPKNAGTLEVNYTIERTDAAG